jgi:hypothetical protein
LMSKNLEIAIVERIHNPVEERPFKGRVARSRKTRPSGPVYRFGIACHKL